MTANRLRRLVGKKYRFRSSIRSSVHYSNNIRDNTVDNYITSELQRKQLTQNAVTNKFWKVKKSVQKLVILVESIVIITDEVNRISIDSYCLPAIDRRLDGAQHRQEWQPLKQAVQTAKAIEWVLVAIPSIAINYLTHCALPTATRREEVCGIRAKFPTKIPVSFYLLFHSIHLSILKYKFISVPEMALI